MKSILHHSLTWLLSAVIFLFTQSLLNAVFAQGSFSISGNVFNDGNGLNDVGGARVNTFGMGALSTVDGPVSVGLPLYVTIVDALGTPLATQAVTSSGTYSFIGLSSGIYTIVLSTYSSGSASPGLLLPEGWNFAGEQIGVIPGNVDLIADGTLSGISIVNADVVNVNFGINMSPVATIATDVPRLNPGGEIRSDVTDILFAATDIEDGIFSPGLLGETVRLRPVSGGNIYYDGTLVYINSPLIINFNPALVSVDPDGTSDLDIVEVIFNYTVTDDAGVESNLGVIYIPFITSALPVTLASFEVSRQDDGSASLEWATTWESSADRFDIEYSNDAKAWDKIGFATASGESATRRTYKFRHADVRNGRNMYRLKMIDFDGRFTYSKIRLIDIRDADHEVSVYPNPAFDKLQIKGLAPGEKYIGKLINASGSTLIASDCPADGFALDSVPAGQYTFQLFDNKGVAGLYKVVVIK